MVPEFVSLLEALFFFMELVIYKRICIALMQTNALITMQIQHHGIIECYENGSKEMLNLYFLCLSILSSMQGSKS